MTGAITLTQEQLVEIVNSGATAAVEKVMARLRFRVILLAALAGAIVSCAIAIPVTAILSHDAATKAAQQAQANAITNCRNISSLAAIEASTYAEQAQQTAIFEAQSKDRFGLTQSQFDKLMGDQSKREQARIAQLQAIASTLCGSNVQTPVAKTTTGSHGSARTPPARKP